MAHKDIERRRKANRERMRRTRAKQASVVIPEAMHQQDRDSCRHDLLRFMQVFLGHLFPLPFSDAHREVIANLQTTILTGGNFAIAMPRGSGKSTMILAALLWAILYGHRVFLVIVRATYAEAKLVIGDLRDILENTETKIAEAFPEVFAPFAALEGSPRRAMSQIVNGKRTKLVLGIDRIVFPEVEGSNCSGSIIMAKGAQGTLRGTAKNAIRPDFVLCDDVITSEAAFCSSSQERIRRFMDAEVAGLAGPGKTVSSFFLCTIQRKGCLSDDFTDPKIRPAWNGRRYSALITPPERLDLWSEYETRRKANPNDADALYAANRTEMDRGASVLWKERFDPTKESSALQHLWNWRTDHGEEAFLTEMQNDPPAEQVQIEDALSTKDITRKVVSIEKLIVPNTNTRIVVGVDVGKHLLHYVVVAFDLNKSGHVLDYGVVDVPSNPDTVYAIRTALKIFRDDYIRRGWQDETGNTRSPDLIIVDSGYCPDAVYRHCHESGFLRWKPSKGHGSGEKNGVRLSKYYIPKDITSGILAGQGWYINKIQYAILAHIDVDFFKESLLDKWKLDVGEPGGMTVFNAVWQDHIRFASHMTSERLAEDFVPGKGLTRKWIKQSRANHWLDCCVYSLAGASMLGIGCNTPIKTPSPLPVTDKPVENNLPKQHPISKPRQVKQRKIINKEVKRIYAPGYVPLPY